MTIEFGFVNRPCQGETANGDSWLLEEYEGGVLMSVVDGLGHGPNAEEAALLFTHLVREDPQAPLLELMTAAGKRLASSRGAAAALLRFNEAESRVEFTGVGNIHMHAVADVKMYPVCAPGVVGHRVRKLLPFEFELPQTALVALCSDGISSRLHLENYEHLEPQQIAEALLAEHGKDYDDATALVVRFTAGPA
jgi:phosphoserine phosphatase RsbX